MTEENAVIFSRRKQCKAFYLTSQRLTETECAVIAAVDLLKGAGYCSSIRKKILDVARMDISVGRVYKILEKFERMKWTSSEWIDSGNRRGRRKVRVYRITKLGETGLIHAREGRRRVGMLRKRG